MRTPLATWRGRAERRRAQARDAVAQFLMTSPGSPGMRIIDGTGLSPRRTYVALAELERDGLVMAWWADGPRPRRRLYMLTARWARLRAQQGGEG